MIERLCATGKITEEEKTLQLEAEAEKERMHEKYLVLWSMVGLQGRQEYSLYNNMEEVKVRESVSSAGQDREED